MKYLSAIENFWKINQTQSLGSTAIAMYFFLLKVWEDNKQKDFKLSDIQLAKNIEVARQTIKPTRNKLSESGLIIFNAKNGSACRYSILENPQNHFIPKEKVRKRIRVKSNVPQKEKILDDDLYKIPIPNSIKEEELFYNDKIPSIEEFLDFAKNLQSYNENLDYLIEEKYKIWKENSWKNAYGRPIANWKTLLKSSMPYLKNASISSPEKPKIPIVERPKIP